MALPNFFIVGAPKSATTAVYEYLRQHPEIFMPRVKELHFFGTDLQFLPPARNFSSVPRSDEDLAFYLSFFAEAHDAKAIGEASVWYLYSRRAAQEIKDLVESAKIIIMLRNPVDLLYSLHSQFLWEGNEDIEDFEEALAAEADRRQGQRLPKTLQFPQGLFYTDVVKFYEQVHRYLKVFGPDNVLVLLYEDFARDPRQSFCSVLRFLGVSETFLPEFQRVNPSKRVRSKMLRDLLVRPPSIVRLMGKTLLPGQIRSRVIPYLRKINTKCVPRSGLHQDTRSKLLQEFQPEIEKLQNLLDRDLSL